MPALLPSMAGVFFIVAVVGAASATASRRVAAGREHLHIALAIFGVSAASLLAFIAYWIHPVAGSITSVTIIVLSIGYLAVRRAWRQWRSAVPMLALSFGVLVVYLSLLYLWSTDMPMFTLAGHRFSHLLPIDNVIPSMVSGRLASGQSTHALVDDWNGSDRPPLQAGLILFVLPIGNALGLQNFSTAASVVAQILWVPAVIALLRAVGVAKVTTLLSTVALAVTGTMLINTLYTWPKLLSAALVLTSCVFLVDADRRPQFFGRGLALATSSFAFALLAHGGAAFALPLVVTLGLIACRHHPMRRAVRASVVAAAIALLVYSPWALYQRLADPPGDRLLKWHLAGVIAPDDRSFAEALVTAYSSVGFDTWLAARAANLLAVVDPSPFAGIGSLSDRRAAEFFTTTTAIGLAYPLGVVILVIMLVSLFRLRRVRPRDRPVILMSTTAIGCIALWCLAMFLPASTLVHQGSHVWIMLLIVVPIVWLAQRKLWLALAVIAAQTIVTAVLYVPSLTSSILDPLALTLLAVGLALCLVAARLYLRSVPLVRWRAHRREVFE